MKSFAVPRTKYKTKCRLTILSVISLKLGHRRASSYGSTPANTAGIRVNSPYNQRPQRTDFGLNHGHSYTQLDPQHDGNIIGQSSYVGGHHPALIPQDHGYCK